MLRQHTVSTRPASDPRIDGQAYLWSVYVVRNGALGGLHLILKAGNQGSCMKWLSILLLAAWMLVGTATSEVAAQGLQPEALRAGHQATVAELWDPQPLPGLTNSTGSIGQPPSIAAPIVLATNTRSWIRYPAIGAAVGAVAASVYIYQQCKGEDCILHPLGPPVLGAAAGALLGLGVELLLRTVTGRD